MATRAVREVGTGRTGLQSNTLERSYVRIFMVEMTSINDNSKTVLAEPTLPQLYAAYQPPGGEADMGSWCYERRAENQPNTTIWKVTLNYSNRLDRPDLNQFVPPLDRPAEVSWDSTTISIPIQYDVFGNLIENSAGDPFDPPVSIEESRIILRMTKNLSTFDPLFYLNYHNKVNDRVWTVNDGLGLWTFKARQVKCKKFSAYKAFEDGGYFAKVTGEFEIRRTRRVRNEDGGLGDTLPLKAQIVVPDGEVVPIEDDRNSIAWTTFLLDRGFREIAQVPRPTAGQKVPILDLQTSMALSIPSLLDGNGHKLTVGADPFYVAYETLESINFNVLSLP